jgi:hypothetical protein
MKKREHIEWKSDVPVVLRELRRLLRQCGESCGCAAVCCERMEGAREARAEVRLMIRQRIKELEFLLESNASLERQEPRQ